MNFLLHGFADWASERPRRLLAVATIVTLPLAWIASGLEISTSRTALVSDRNPHWQRYMAFAEEFGIPEDLVIVVDGEDPTSVRRFMDEVVISIRDEPGLAQSVFHRVDLSAFERHGLLYLDEADLDRLRKIAELEPTRRLMSDEPAAARISALSALLGQAPTIVGPDAGPRQSELMAMTLGRLIDAFHGYALEGREGPLSLLDRKAALSAALDDRGAPGGIDAEGYFTLHDGTTGVVFVRPPYTRDEMQVVLPFVARVRAACAKVAEQIPSVEYGLTGIPATQRDEFYAIQRDTVLTSVVALVGVALLFLAFLPTLRMLAYALVPVAYGVVWTAACVRLLFGYVNLMSSVFLVVLIGMGIDFSIHLSARYLEGRQRGMTNEEAVRQAVLRSGRGVVTGAVTSAGAFAAVGWCGFQGIEQLGIAAGLGLLFTLVAALTVFPAILTWAGPGMPARPPRALGLGSWATWIGRRPYAPLVAAALLTIPVAYSGWHIRFNFSLVDLLPKDAESARLMDRMLSERDLSANAAVVAAPSLHEARVVAAELRAKPTVYSVHDAAMFLPSHQQARLGVLAEMKRSLNQPVGASAAVSIDEAVMQLEDEVEALTDLAMQRRREVAAKTLELALEKVAAVSEEVEDPEVAAGVQRFADAVREAAHNARRRLEETVEAGPVSIEALPEPLRRRFVSPEGRYAVYAVPRYSMWDREALAAFVKEVRSVAEDATGFPETFYENAGLLRSAFVWAALYASLAVLMLLSIDLRRPRDVLLASVPVGLGVVWMIGLMQVLGVPYNLANIVALPLIIGVGIDNGVHLMHRYRESGSMVEAMKHTGTAVALSSLTTMVGFGSLALSSHRGLASMGVMMLLGVGSCLLISITVVPAALAVVERLDRRRGRLPAGARPVV